MPPLPELVLYSPTNRTSNNTHQERQIRREVHSKNKTENTITDENIQEYEHHKREQTPKYNQKNAE
jgi:hypothetical protein